MDKPPSDEAPSSNPGPSTSASSASYPDTDTARPPKVRRSTGGFAFGILRAGMEVVLLALVVIATLFVSRWYQSAKAQLVPVLVTPATNFDAASAPPVPQVMGRMKDMAMERLNLKPAEMPKAVALTFDDGPYPLLTPALLDLLARHKVKATFFVVGRDSQMQPELLRRMVMEGHELGNHSYTHASFQDLDLDGIRGELDQTDVLIRSITGQQPRIMRPPGGRLDNQRLALVQQMGYTVVLDNVNPGDWRETDPLTIYSYTMWRTINRAVLLLHSGRIGTIRALPTMIDGYKKKGYQFVTVSELAKLTGVEIPGPK